MFEIFNLLVISAQLLDPNLINLRTVEFPPRHQVVVMEFQPVALRWSKKRECRYYGLMVPYTRTWEEKDPSDQTGMSTLAPEPDQVVGYGIVVNKKTCPETGVEKVFAAGEYVTGTDRVGRPYIQHAQIYVNPIVDNPEKNPKWLPQVVATIEKAAETDQAAKAFLDFAKSTQSSIKVQTSEKQSQTSPELAPTR
ncbi:hypothetical protein EDC30_11935 [Paucimonas lemoignei]|uniref:Uncharacterized protein n=1 Tax=Paucimonas lemoignei TaxID=29443 RepID=A0A4R3HP39_PAULE|nr:hypothetical protein [Paucimonas lemoignei]TCS32924.1 hypothetical protein EDC30_11935 [Paucimonas lemoignei]